MVRVVAGGRDARLCLRDGRVHGKQVVIQQTGYHGADQRPGPEHLEVPQSVNHRREEEEDDDDDNNNNYYYHHHYY